MFFLFYLPAYLLQLNLLGIELCLLSFQLVSLFLEVISPHVQVLFLLSQVLFELPHLLICIDLVLLQRLKSEHNRCGAPLRPNSPFLELHRHD